MNQVNIKSTVLLTAGFFLLIFLHFVPLGFSNGGIRHHIMVPEDGTYMENNMVANIELLNSFDTNTNSIAGKALIEQLSVNPQNLISLAKQEMKILK